MARLREGRANTARGAAHFLRETVGRVRYGGASGQLTARADSGFYAHALVAVCGEMDVRFSITIRQHKSLRNLIEAIPDADWTPVPYWMDGAADVAETTCTPFRTEPGAAPVRLIVRRVKPTPGSQLALFATYSYHGFMMSVHDPEMRHGHRSSSRRFDGHKAAIVVDTDSQLITAVEVLPGNAPDNLGALELVEQSEANTGVPVEEAMGDAASAKAIPDRPSPMRHRTLIARVQGRPNRSHFPKEDFRIDLESGSCTCPAGQVTRTIVPAGRRTDQMGRTYRLEAFRFDAAVCGACPCGPSAWRQNRVRGGRSGCTRRKLYCSRPAPCSTARVLLGIGNGGWWWSTDWRGWSNWESASPATSAASKPGSSCTWPPRWPT